MQWVTYVLWESSLAALSTLLTATLSYFFIIKTGDYGFVMYVLAMVVCLVPFALLSDMLYSKREPAQKHGFAAVVLVLNAVIVFIATLIGLITAVISALSLVVDATPSNAKNVVIAASLTVTLLGVLLFMRIINVPKLAMVRRYYRWIVAGVTILTILFAIGGPLKSQVQTRNDRLIEDNLTTIATAVETYFGNHGALPASLRDVSIDSTYDQGAQALIDRRLVTYQRHAGNGGQQYGSGSSYDLCVTYHKAKGTGDYASATSGSDYIDTSSHGADYHCYKLTAAGGGDIVPLNSTSKTPR